jgi:hypothetical protein
MSRKETSLRTVSSLRFFTECVNRRHPFILTGLGITRAIQALASVSESKEDQPGLEIQRFTVVGIKKGAPISKDRKGVGNLFCDRGTATSLEAPACLAVPDWLPETSYHILNRHPRQRFPTLFIPLEQLLPVDIPTRDNVSLNEQCTWINQGTRTSTLSPVSF